MKSKILAMTALSAALLGASGIASANIIANGDFETGNLSGWTTSGLTCSGVGTGYSSATGGCVGYDSDPGAYAGTFAAYLGTAAGGGIISQSLLTSVGQNYLVEFELAIGSYNGTSTPNSLILEAGSNTLLSLVNAPTQGYTHYSYVFAASSAATILKFTHGDVPSFFALDNVQARAVPEPASLGLMGLGIAAVGLIRRRRNKA